MVPSCLKLVLLAAVVSLATAHCPPYWTAFKDSCFQLFNQPMTWEQAEEYCMGFSTCEGNQVGHLAYIGAPDTNGFIVKYKKIIEVQGGPAARIWIGFNDLMIERQFEWTNYANATYTNWEIGQPNNAQGQEHCVAMPGYNSLDQWDDANCLEVLPFVCELPGVDPRAEPPVYFVPLY